MTILTIYQRFMDILTMTCVVEDDVTHRINVMMGCMDVRPMMTVRQVSSEELHM